MLYDLLRAWQTKTKFFERVECSRAVNISGVARPFNDQCSKNVWMRIYALPPLYLTTHRPSNVD